MPEAYDTTAILARLDAIERTLAQGECLTRDLGGEASTEALGAAIAAALSA